MKGSRHSVSVHLKPGSIGVTCFKRSKSCVVLIFFPLPSFSLRVFTSKPVVTASKSLPFPFGPTSGREVFHNVWSFLGTSFLPLLSRLLLLLLGRQNTTDTFHKTFLWESLALLPLPSSLKLRDKCGQEEVGYVRRGTVSRQACFHMLGAFSAPTGLIKAPVIPQFMLP